MANDEEDFRIEYVEKNATPRFYPTQLPLTLMQSQQDDLSQEKTLSDTSDLHPTTKRGKYQKRTITDVDKSFADYLNMKKQILEATLNECNQQKKNVSFEFAT